MIEARLATAAAPGWPVNEDYAFAVPGLVGVLDGVSDPACLDTGCVHGAAWYVRRLAARIIEAAGSGQTPPLSEVLAVAIRHVRDDHEGRCDLDHVGTPAATVCLLREANDHVEYLVLCDSSLVLDHGHHVQVVTDGRFGAAVADLRARALNGQHTFNSIEHDRLVREAVLQRRQHTNQPDGYWIAAANPEAARHAVVGSEPLSGPRRVRRAALLTDGAADAVERFKLTDWRGLLEIITLDGPGALIARVRTAEDADDQGRDQPRYKRHDDATIVLCLFEQGER